MIVTEIHQNVRLWAIPLALLTLGLTTGCQVDVAGQTLPSAYYISDDIQYFPAGPEFQLTNEAAAMKAYEAQRELDGR